MARQEDMRATDLLREAAARYGCLEAGVVSAPIGSWGPRDSHAIPLLDGMRLSLAHDERDAPVALAEGSWDDSLLVSLSDEGSLAACAWARPNADSALIGLGIDLADRADFAGERGATFNHLLFTAREHELAARICPADIALGYAFAFSAKEAAFKACAAPLRAWYREHDEELTFDLRGFELADVDREAGTARRHEAQRAMGAMGICRIELVRTVFYGLALTLACAIGKSS